MQTCRLPLVVLTFALLARTFAIAESPARFSAVEMGAIGAALGDEVRVTQGAVGTVLARDVRIEQAVVRTVVANNVRFERTTGVLFLVARRVEGNVRVLLDWRGAIVFGAAMGVVMSIFRRRR